MPLAARDMVKATMYKKVSAYAAIRRGFFFMGRQARNATPDPTDSHRAAARKILSVSANIYCPPVSFCWGM